MHATLHKENHAVLNILTKSQNETLVYCCMPSQNGKTKRLCNRNIATFKCQTCYCQIKVAPF